MPLKVKALFCLSLKTIKLRNVEGIQKEPVLLFYLAGWNNEIFDDFWSIKCNRIVKFDIYNIMLLCYSSKMRLF